MAGCGGSGCEGGSGCKGGSGFGSSGCGSSDGGSSGCGVSAPGAGSCISIDSVLTAPPRDAHEPTASSVNSVNANATNVPYTKRDTVTLPKPLIHYSKYSKSDPSFLFGATDAAQA